MGRVLVTGGAGFVGSHVVDALVEAGHAVRVLDARLPSAEVLNPAAEYVPGDVRDAALVRDALRGVSAVSHQASMVGLGGDFSDVVDYVSQNALGTAVLLRALAVDDFRGRVVLASSMVVYGDGRYSCRRHGRIAVAPRRREDLERGAFEPRCGACGEPLEPEPVGEDAPPDPRNVYAATKLHQEHLSRAFARETGVPVAALRYHNVYGPRMPHGTRYAGVAALFASALARGESPRVFEDGCQLRDFVHVRDVARANLLALDAEPPLDCALNVASGRPRTVGELAWALWRASEGGCEPLVTGEFRLGDVRHVFASTARARAELGYEPRVGFAEGIAELAGSLVPPLRPSASS